MWWTEDESLLIDHGYDLFIVRIGRREEYERALLKGPWMIGDNYLCVQRWRPNFDAETTVIKVLHV